jgi:hypothetical protein
MSGRVQASPADSKMFADNAIDIGPLGLGWLASGLTAAAASSL